MNVDMVKEFTNSFSSMGKLKTTSYTCEIIRYYFNMDFQLTMWPLNFIDNFSLLRVNQTVFFELLTIMIILFRREVVIMLYSPT